MPVQSGPIIIAAATAAIGNFFQNRSADIARKKAIHDAELTRAESIFREVTTSMDNLFFYLRHVAMPVAIRKARKEMDTAQEDAASWAAFDQALMTWTVNKNRLCVVVRRYFGDESKELLEKIHDGLALSKRFVVSTYYGRSASIVEEGMTEDELTERYKQYKEQVDEVEPYMVQLSDIMMGKIQHQTVGILGQEDQDG